MSRWMHPLSLKTVREIRWMQPLFREKAACGQIDAPFPLRCVWSGGFKPPSLEEVQGVRWMHPLEEGACGQVNVSP